MIVDDFGKYNKQKHWFLSYYAFSFLKIKITNIFFNRENSSWNIKVNNSDPSSNIRSWC